MAIKLDLNNLAMRNKFTFSTEAIGEIEIGNYTFGAYKDLHDEIKDFSKVTPEELLKKLIISIGKKPSKEDGEKIPITRRELEQLNQSDLETFSEKYIENNAWLFDDQDNPVHEKDADGVVKIKYNKIDTPKEEGETNREYLYRLICENDKKQNERLKEIIKPFANMSSNISKMLKSNFDISKKLGSTIYDSHNKIKIGSSYTSPVSNFSDLKIPENPIHKTNERLNQVLSNLDSLRPFASESALLIKSLNDTAIEMASAFTANAKRDSRYNKIMLSIAAVSLFLSAIFSFLNYQDSKTKIIENVKFYESIIEQNRKINIGISLLEKKLSQKLGKLLIEQNKINLNLINLVEINKESKVANEKIITKNIHLKNEMKSNKNIQPDRE